MCFLCGSAPETLAHLHTTCPAVIGAITSIIRHTADKSAVLVLRTAEADDYIFRASTTMSDTDRLTLLLLSRAVWRTRNSFVEKPFHPSFTAKAAQSIVAIFRELQATASSTQKRKKRNREKQRREFEALFASLSPSTRVYTDGSSYGNPGPSGSGFIVGKPGQPTTYHSFSLGRTTNNVAELTGSH